MQKLTRDGQVLYMSPVLSPLYIAQGWEVESDSDQPSLPSNPDADLVIEEGTDQNA